MTLCIAAVCQENGEPRIVLVSDSKESTETWSVETGFKLEELWPNRLLALYAGDVADAKELAAIYRSNAPAADIDADDLHEQLREPLKIRKDRIANAVAGKYLGLSYAEFLARKDQFDEWVRTMVFNEILYYPDVDLIAAGFFAKGQRRQARLLTVVNCNVGQKDHFACIGSASEAATQVLARYEHTSFDDLGKTLYRAYEAKRAGELSPSVGTDTRVMVLFPGQSGGPYQLRRIHPQLLDTLTAAYYENNRRCGEFTVPDGTKWYIDV